MMESLVIQGMGSHLSVQSELGSRGSHVPPRSICPVRVDLSSAGWCVPALVRFYFVFSPSELLSL